ncbi:hypothetical protein Ahia01_000737600 [Argonauta hians]
MNASMKDIPYPNQEEHLQLLTHSIVNLIQKIRWKTWIYNNKENKNNNVEGDTNLIEFKKEFKTTRTPPPNHLLAPLERDLLNIVSELRFKPVGKTKSKFQKKLDKIINKIKFDKDILVLADKTGNSYFLKPEKYVKLVYKELRSNYKVAKYDDLTEINTIGYNIITKLNLESRTTPYAPSTPWITIKDHKPNFAVNLPTRLICPTKNDLAKISRIILSKTIPALRLKIKLTQWDYTKQVIEWFYALNKSIRTKFLQVDISNYYASITPELLNKALLLAKKYTNLNDTDIDTILHARKTLITFGDKLWTKSNNANLFDITMGSDDSAQVTDIVGIYILHEIQNRFPQLEGGAYRDDFLLVTNSTNRNYDRVKKELHHIFNTMNLKIEIQNEYRKINYLDVTLDLDNQTVEPYHKQNEMINYINAESNHPRHMKDAIVTSIATRVSTLSHDITKFEKHSNRYNNALTKAGYTTRIKYVKQYSANPQEQIINNTNHNGQSRNRHNNNNNNWRNSRHTRAYKKPSKRYKGRDVIWFNPVFNLDVTTKIGKKFFEALEKNIPKGHKYRCLFNKNTIKLSYTTAPNLKAYINKYNNIKLKRYFNKLNKVKHISPTNTNNLTDNEIEHSNRCNCRTRASCPGTNICRKTNVVYQCRVTTNNNSINDKFYVGQTTTELKVRVANHNHTFRTRGKRYSTSLANYIWYLREQNLQYKVAWRIVRRAGPANNIRNICRICTTELTTILRHNHKNRLLNKPTENIATCQHRQKLTYRYRANSAWSQ